MEEDTKIKDMIQKKASIKVALDHAAKHKDFRIGLGAFSTAFDELYHHKLIRLANEFYNFDLSSDVGMIQFELFMHAYDISPGEEGLDRIHSYPTPLHTYEELPIIKFDGFEESDDPEIHQLAHNSSHKH